MTINPREVSDLVPDHEAVRVLLGTLTSMARNLAELRNSSGTGHGKTISYVGLTERHANLAAGASLALVDYLWATHLERKASARGQAPGS
ncbi:abortive infection family protein [Pseudoglutamicibacter cumminsii]|uniref:abortive infection family protein n=1 Tax=Pseudoglutamicibacter cumminsii TaxID=156979 RepID=UPI001956B013